MLTSERTKGKRATVVAGERISGESVAGQQLEAQAAGSGSRRPNGRLHGTRSEIEPLLFAVAQRGQANPVQDPSFIVVEVEDNGCGRAIKEVKPPLTAFPSKRQAADAMTGQARQRSFAIGQGKKDQVHQSFTSTGHMAAQAEQALAVLAESRQADRKGAAVGPEELIAFVRNAFIDMVTGSITAK